MRSFTVASLMALLAGSASAQVCNADNCLRGIRATQRPGLEDCMSYLETTVTPAASTVTATETQTETVTPTVYFSVTGTSFVLVTATAVESRTQTSFVTITQTLNNVFRRQATEVPTAIPTYASACSGAVRYSSACRCLGATAATITAEAPTVTVTAVDTVTVSPVTVNLPTTVATVDVTTTVDTATVTTTVVVGATQTVQIPFPTPPQCVNLASRNMLYLGVDPGRPINLWPGFQRSYAFTDEGRARCCAQCHAIANCGVFFLAPTNNGQGLCQIWENSETIPRSQSAQCFRGIAPFTWVSQGGSSGYGLGPCFRD